MDERQLSQAEILESIREGGHKGFQYLKNKMSAKIRQHVRKNSGSSVDADDLFQDAAISLYLNIKEGKFQPQNESSLEAYFMRICVFQWKSKLRKTKRLGEVELKEFDKSDDSGENDDLMLYDQKMDLMLAHFNQMGSPCKEVLEKFYFHKLSLDEIASEFEWTYGYARKVNYKCKKRLQKKIESDDSYKELF